MASQQTNSIHSHCCRFRGHLVHDYVRFKQPPDARIVARLYEEFFAGSPWSGYMGKNCADSIFGAYQYADIGFQLDARGDAEIIVSCLDNC